ncbi:GNAT family N-acetyltransferase [Enterococcus sp. LJL120]|uniref:GNAT family N-acetyltransferase n=1 Tax=Enterococcus sp. HY326 TaxID=2971265 RepID=UPI0022404E69|nr:GNAT family N-acetyltransferase [Enterococcus sp. HY326]
MLSIQLTTPLSKDFFEAVSLRKQTSPNKINYLKEQKYITFVARYQQQIVGTASLQIFTNSMGRIREIAVTPDFENKFVEQRLIRFIEDFLTNRNSGNRPILFGKKAYLTQAV